MNTMLLALGHDALRGTCRRFLEHRGYCVLHIDRPLAVLSVSATVRWDVALLDNSPLGRGALEALSLSKRGLLVGLGFEDERLSATLLLPLEAESLASTLEALIYANVKGEGAELMLNPLRRVASRGGREVFLTRIEFRLLQLLHDRRPADVTLAEVLIAIWGSTEGQGTSELVRAHLRNLRRKLLEIGLTDAIRSRRGRGYSLDV